MSRNIPLRMKVRRVTNISDNDRLSNRGCYNIRKRQQKTTTMVETSSHEVTGRDRREHTHAPGAGSFLTLRENTDDMAPVRSETMGGIQKPSEELEATVSDGYDASHGVGQNGKKLGAGLRGMLSPHKCTFTVVVHTPNGVARPVRVKENGEAVKHAGKIPKDIITRVGTGEYKLPHNNDNGRHVSQSGR